MIPPIVWIPAGFALGLGLLLWAGMSWAYDRGKGHGREEEYWTRQEAMARRRHPIYRAADRAWELHQRQALELANTVPDAHPSGPMRRLEPLPPVDDMTDSAFTRTMRDEVARGMAMVEAILRGEP